MRPTASSRTPRPLRSSWRPTNKTVWRSSTAPSGPGGSTHGSADANWSTSTPLNRIVHGSGIATPARACASWETATLASIRDPNQRARLDIDLYIGCSPAAWNVPTIGAERSMSAVTVGPGTSGSCRWRTSNFSSHSARMVRSCAWGLGEIGAMEPLAAFITDGPMTVTPPSVGGASAGARIWTLCPRSRSARARPSTWPCTPPGTVRLYGQTIPMCTTPTLLSRDGAAA